jgi:hypothetical protein
MGRVVKVQVVYGLVVCGASCLCGALSMGCVVHGKLSFWRVVPRVSGPWNSPWGELSWSEMPWDDSPWGELTWGELSENRKS